MPFYKMTFYIDEKRKELKTHEKYYDIRINRFRSHAPIHLFQP